MVQRSHPRYAVEVEAQVRLPDQQVSGRTQNVSRGGFCMFADRPLPVGAACETLLALVFSDNQLSEQLALPATIVWCTPLGGKYQVGFKFAPMISERRNYLSLFIKFLEGEEEVS
jgi:Tfp pilus assembly protein PilZ